MTRTLSMSDEGIHMCKQVDVAFRIPMTVQLRTTLNVVKKPKTFIAPYSFYSLRLFCSRSQLMYEGGIIINKMGYGTNNRKKNVVLYSVTRDLETPTPSAGQTRLLSSYIVGSALYKPWLLIVMLRGPGWYGGLGDPGSSHMKRKARL